MRTGKHATQVPEGTVADLKGYALCRRPRCGFGWPEDGFGVVRGWFLGDLGTILGGSEASWKGLESLGGQLEGIGEPWRPLERPGDAQKPGL